MPYMQEPSYFSSMYNPHVVLYCLTRLSKLENIHCKVLMVSFLQLWLLF